MIDRFIIVEDHTLVRTAVSKLIEEKSSYTCAGVCSSLKETLGTLSAMTGPVICLLDLNLGDEDGLDIIRAIKADYPQDPCIVYSMYQGVGIVTEAAKAGADGYVSKNAEVSELVTAFDTAQHGEFYLESSLTSNFVLFTSLMQSLTTREKEVFSLIMKRNSNEEICKKMGIEKHSVENYLTRVFAKLGVKNREELIQKFG